MFQGARVPRPVAQHPAPLRQGVHEQRVRGAAGVAVKTGNIILQFPRNVIKKYREKEMTVIGSELVFTILVFPDEI